ncbi:Hypothetical predicted protein [Podarcis lilfordi]|uniref:Uncharacterized protein n=1 Tax=Podarcis lilfordi TaxID=74358 RepID=A0AA35KY41_9SAUR|nr:Hypothetical predicted protein [Podarcis lilfordi]
MLPPVSYLETIRQSKRLRLNSKCLCPKTYHRSTVIKRVLIQKPSREVIFTERRSVSGGSEKTVDDPVKATVDA